MIRYLHYVFKHVIYLFWIGTFFGCTTAGKKQFTLINPSSSGVKFKNILKETKEFNVLTYGYLYNGGGVAIGDLNNDGLSDIYFTGNMVGSRLYINKGNLKFDEIAEEAGVFAAGLWNTGVTMADVNGDGFLDIYVCRSATKNDDKRRNQLFINNGNLTFTEKGKEFGVDNNGYSTQAAFFDFDRDGDLDLYIMNHSTQTYAGLAKISKNYKKQNIPVFSDKLLRNDEGKFIDITNDAGLISNVLGFGLGIATSDVNNDGWTDIYISNDYNEQDYLYINNGDGTFVESLTKYIGHTSLYSMGSDIADINNDGFTDIMTLDMLPEGNYRQKMVSGPDNFEKLSRLNKNGFYHQTMRNMLQLNFEGKYFAEIGQFSGVSNTDWSWASLFADFNNDGLKDLFITNGYKKDYTNMDFMNFLVQEKLNERATKKEIVLVDLIEKMPSTIVENYTYQNNGDLTFSKRNKEWGLDQLSLSNGAAYGDLDNDGDLDLVVNNIDQPAFVYRNNAESISENNFIKIKLKGSGTNTFGIGSKITVITKNSSQVQELFPTRGFQSSVDYSLVFGIGNAIAVDTIKINWPDASTQILKNIKANQSIVLNQDDAVLQETEEELLPKALFEDVTHQLTLNSVHVENEYVDFKRQILLPQMLSTLGPKIAIGDVNTDGLQDAYIGGAMGSEGSFWIQTKAGEFKQQQPQAFQETKNAEDMGSLFFDMDNDGDDDLYVVSGGNEFESNAPALQDRLYLNNNGTFVLSEKRLPSLKTSGSVVISNDFDQDGDLDLFIGGRLVPNQYPKKPESYLLQNDGNGVFSDVTNQFFPALQNLGMVTDAIWTDFDDNGYDDLIIVGEFMPIRFFANNNGMLKEIKSAVENSTGWWNKIVEGDFDKDGDLDYLVGNFGHNSQLKTSADSPITIFAKDFDENGSMDPILCSYYENKLYPVFSKDDLQEQLPFLKNRFVKYTDYAKKTIYDIFTILEFKDVIKLTAQNFSSSYLENLGSNNFSIRPLPSIAQFSPIYAMYVDDFNNDGNLDVLLGGNFTGSRVKFGHYDATRGICLLGNGKGEFYPLKLSESGLNIDGEVRDIESFIDAQNNTYYIFSKNNDAAQIFKLNKQ